MLVVCWVEQKKLVDQIDVIYQDEVVWLVVFKCDEVVFILLVSKLQVVIDEVVCVVVCEVVCEYGGYVLVGGGKMLVLVNICGSLLWLVVGVVYSYGNGVLIKVFGGSEVYVVVKGWVVFVNFLCGYGMLVIFDYGGGWMSMYGNNEVLLYCVGDILEVGEVVGIVMVLIGVNIGVYFELCYGNKLVDLCSWLVSYC